MERPSTGVGTTTIFEHERPSFNTSADKQLKGESPIHHPYRKNKPSRINLNTSYTSHRSHQNLKSLGAARKSNRLIQRSMMTDTNDETAKFEEPNTGIRINKKPLNRPMSGFPMRQ